MDRNKRAMLLLKKEESQVAGQRQQVHQGEQQLHAVLQTLRMTTSRGEAVGAIDDADHTTDEEKQRTEHCLGAFPDGDTVTTIRKVSVPPLKSV